MKNVICLLFLVLLVIPLSASSFDITYEAQIQDCPGLPVEVTITISGGVTPYIIDWASATDSGIWNSSSGIYTFNALCPAPYYVTVTDNSNCQVEETINYIFNEIPACDDSNCFNGFEYWDAEKCACKIIAPILGCANPSAANYNPAATCQDESCYFFCPDPGNCDDGDDSNGIEIWDYGICECYDESIIPPSESYCNDGDCGTQDIFDETTGECLHIPINPSPINTLELTIDITKVSCFGRHDGACNITVEGGIPPYEFTWLLLQDYQSNNDELFFLYEEEDLFNIKRGMYQLSVVDSEQSSCITSIINIEVEEALQFSIFPSSASCEECASIEVCDISGGTPPYLVSLNDGPFSSQLFYENLLLDNYSIVVKDARDCTREINVALSLDTDQILTLNSSPISCGTYSGFAVIQSTGSLGQGEVVNFSAGCSVLLESGFEVPLNSEFLGEVVPCEE